MDVIPTIRAGEPPSHYLAYLNSPGWRVVRNRALKRSGFQCSKCPARRELHVHHKTYERLGMERDSDVEVLCSTCHRGEHLENPEQTSLGIYLRLASAALKLEPFASIADLAEAVRQMCAKHKIQANPARINSALAVVCGNRLQSAPREQPATVKAEPRAVTKAEAQQLLIRLTAKFGALNMRQIPASKPSTIDIYGAVPRPDWGEHDVY
jgi:hypothetical protein